MKLQPEYHDQKSWHAPLEVNKTHTYRPPFAPLNNKKSENGKKEQCILHSFFREDI